MSSVAQASTHSDILDPRTLLRSQKEGPARGFIPPTPRSPRSVDRWRMALLGHHVALDLSLELGHVLTAGHEIGDLLAAHLALAEIRSLGASDEDDKVISDRKGMDDVVGDEDDRDALLARLKNDAKDVRRLLDAERSGRLVEDQHAGTKM